MKLDQHWNDNVFRWFFKIMLFFLKFLLSCIPINKLRQLDQFLEKNWSIDMYLNFFLTERSLINIRVFPRTLLKLHNFKNPNRMMFVPFCSKWSAHFWFLRTAASSKELKRRMTSYIHNLIMVGWSFTSHWVINPQNHSIN